MAAKMAIRWVALRASCLPSSQRALGISPTTRVLAVPGDYQANAGGAQEFQGEKSLAFLLPRALSWHRGQDSTLPPMWAKYFPWLEGTFGHLASQTGIHAGLWHLEGERDFCWGAGALLPGGGWCLVAGGGYWGPQFAPPHPGPAVGPAVFQQAAAGESAERQSLGKATGLGTQRTTGAEHVAHVRPQPLVPGSVQGRRVRGWVLEAGAARSHLGGFRAVTIVGDIAARQGASGSRPAPAEAVQGAAQRAQALPEPELRLAGAPGVVGHALPSPALGRVQRGRSAEGHEQQTAGQQEEDAGEGDEHGEGVSRLCGAARSGRSCEEGQGAGTLCAHGSCNRKGTGAQRQISWTQGCRGKGTLMGAGCC